MPDITKAQNIQSTIRANLNARASTLVRVSEIENDSTEDAIRKLQIQIFELSDAIAGLAEHITKAARGL